MVAKVIVSSRKLDACEAVAASIRAVVAKQLDGLPRLAIGSDRDDFFSNIKRIWVYRYTGLTMRRKSLFWAHFGY